jgi:CheY-like chemotaxis protein/HPt (histidine-containing phosphotransfer) domain-containing protein
MPGMDGVELLDRIHQAHPASTAATVMATAYDHDELQAALGPKTVGAILAKPATPSSLFDSIMLAIHRDASKDVARERATGLRNEKFAGQRVLLVEDNEVNRELAEEMLGNIGLHVDTATNGRLAVEKVEQQPYDLVLMDCHMPVMDGYTATETIRRNPAFAQLPIVAMTANALASDRERCLAAGMNDHIPKPIDVAVLHATLARWLGQPVAVADDQATSPASAESGSNSPLTTIDTVAALARLGGNQAMYHRLLVRFCENQADAARQLQADQAQRDTDAMILRAHTLRGLAGNIGAAKLAAVAGDLEMQLKMGMAANDAAVESKLASLQEVLPETIKDAERLIGEYTPRQAHVDSELANGALSDLHRLLDNDDAQAVRCFEEISSQLRQRFDSHLVEQLSRQINHYEFDEAKETLEQLITQRQHN